MGIDVDQHIKDYDIEFHRKFKVNRRGFKRVTTMLFGCPPNLPWWRIQSMSDAEIADYNRSFMKEVEMSVKELKFEDKHKNTIMKVDKGNSDFKILIIDCCHTEFYLDHNQAHLLYLYLKEHLGQ